MTAGPLRCCYARPDGDLTVAPEPWRAVGRSGTTLTDRAEWIPLPPGSSIARLPGRPVVARRGAGGRLETWPLHRGTAAAAILPVGYWRLLLPAHGPAAGDGPVLPLYGYTALAERDGTLLAAARHSDTLASWDPVGFAAGDLPARVAEAERALPGNPIISQLRRCALEHNCYTAQNTFHRRFEGALPASAACNADCLGCISLQTDSGAPTPQPRLARAPSTADLVAVASYHLSGPEAQMVSFGQGCEGEPLLQLTRLLPAVREIRNRFPGATIHINTNGSRPHALTELVAAGLDSARISAFSFSQPLFAAYYRPRGYSIEDVVESGRRLHRLGAQVAINLLTFPGVTDSPPEVERTVAALVAMGADQLQLRSLNADPLWLLERVPQLPAGIGLPAFLRRLRERLPQLQVGNFTRPVERPGAAMAVAAGAGVATGR